MFVSLIEDLVKLMQMLATVYKAAHFSYVNPKVKAFSKEIYFICYIVIL